MPDSSDASAPGEVKAPVEQREAGDLKGGVSGSGPATNVGFAFDVML